MNHLAKTLLGLTTVGLLTLSASADCQGRGRHHRQRYNQAGYSQQGGCNQGNYNPGQVYYQGAPGACQQQNAVYAPQVPVYVPSNAQPQVYPGQVYLPNQVSYPGYYPTQNGACNNQGYSNQGYYNQNGYYPNGYDPGAQMGLTIMQGLLNSGVLNGAFNR